MHRSEPDLLDSLLAFLGLVPDSEPDRRDPRDDFLNVERLFDSFL